MPQGDSDENEDEYRPSEDFMRELKSNVEDGDEDEKTHVEDEDPRTADDLDEDDYGKEIDGEDGDGPKDKLEMTILLDETHTEAATKLEEVGVDVDGVLEEKLAPKADHFLYLLYHRYKHRNNS